MSTKCQNKSQTIDSNNKKLFIIRRQLNHKRFNNLIMNFTYLTILLCFSICKLCDAVVVSPRSVGTATGGQSSVIASYSMQNKSINLTHIVYDRNSSLIYVGASNWIYQFSANLTLEVAVQTGPIRDNPLCSPNDCNGVDENIPFVNNINKVLVIDPYNHYLIACGSVRQGSCQRHRLSDIAQREELVTVPVASNDENSSTIALVAPAKYFGPHATPVLYVAATNSRLGAYRDMVPAISSRSLESGPKLFNIIEKSFSDTARVDISSHLRDYYLVRYVYAFHSSDFVYFATVQRKSHLRALEEWGYITRLARVCQSDPGYNTYTEVTLQCFGSDGTDYTLLQDAVVVSAGEDLANDLHIDVGNKVLIGVFATAVEHTSNPSSRSAVCVFSLADIEAKFTQNIHMCYNGSVATRNMDYIAGNLPDCPTPGRGGNIVSFCAETLKLNGSQPIQSTSALVYENSTLTAVVALTTGQHTVAFVGTRMGHLKKLLISRSDLAEEFEEVVVDLGNPILSDILIDKTGQYLFVSSPYKISKIAIERCGHYSSCRDCLQARNPYCGWCSLQKSCTLKGECRDHKTSSSSRWLSLDTEQCIDFQSIKPESLPITSTDKVELVINQLPKLPHNANYQCVFGEGPAIDAQATKNGLICRTPPVSWRPQTPLGSDHILVDLSVRSSETKTDFLQRKFAFYDCNAHKTCMDCVQSEWQCNWCSNDNKCSDSKQNCSPNNNLLSNDMPNSGGAGIQPMTAISDQKFCPSFELKKNILLPNGIPKEIILPVKNMPNSNSSFRCVVNIEDTKLLVSARVDANRIICSETAYSYRTEVGSIVASVTVMWNGDTFIDRANVTVYKCHLLGSHNGRADCSLCLTLNPVFECSFCNSQCTFAKSCTEPTAKVCPAPRIDWIHPLSGPVAGGTLVTIEGSNLGTDLAEIKDKITIGGQPCVALNYSVSVRVTCRTNAVAVPMLADVVVGNKAGFTTAKDKFRYEQPEIIASHPNTGPHSGGTRIYITGTNLNIGSNIEIYLDYFECLVDKMLVSSTQISCRTTAAKAPTYVVRNLILRIDNTTLALQNPFRYVPDPTIQRIYPLKSYMSGGRTVTIMGSNLDAIQQPRLAIFSTEGSVLNESTCDVISSTQMVCPSPPVNAQLVDLLYREQLDASSSLMSSLSTNEVSDDIRLRVGFIMDAVNSVKELATNFPTVHSDLGYVPDPKFFAFDEGLKLYKGESLVIEGNNLRLASTESEVNVTIGTKWCNLTSLAATQLVCLPPEVQPDGTDEIGRMTPSGLPLVVVRMGANLRYEVGYLQYEVVKSTELPPIAIVVITVSSLALILFVLISLAIMRHKSSQAEREYKRIQMQMDTLENSVRSECKQAFAELQTDMTDLTNDLESMGIPTLDHRTYVMKVFFPGLSEHPLYQCTRIRTNGAYNIYELAMAQFEQLLNNKQFLLTFINCLENSKTFSIRDRVNVASLVMIILMERMEYATDVMRTLLYQLVDKNVSSKHPQLMLRRTESIVEKMLTNWLALSMYDYVREQAGSQLFLLFSAIKRQVEKGPIDAATHDARYSLSEERLLREHYCDYEQIIIQVFQESENEKILCRVNDCDSISQVKAKLLDTLYKNTPFSLRPSIHDVDLEWRHGRGGHLTLQDEDLTTKSEHGWQRINTLRHYGVKNWALMSLVMRQSSDSYMSCSTRNSLSPIINKSNPFITSDIDSDRYWHLIKPNDDSMDTKDTNLLHKAIPEIFLTRLLSTKGTVQKFVDDFFQTILSANETLPAAVKWVFDLLDSAAEKHQISDPEVLHAWKSNCLPLRFWVNFIKNPDFILDVYKTPTIDSSLSVIAQTLMDSCSTSEHRLGKDSPSNKLLFAKDIPNYKVMVTKFYSEVTNMPTVTDQELSAVMQCLSLTHTGEFDIICALKELFVYAVKYNADIMDCLQRDPLTQTSVQKFGNLINYKF